MLNILVIFSLIIFILFQDITQTMQRSLNTNNLKPAEDRDFDLMKKVIPPKGAPYWGPGGWYGAAKWCPFIVGPLPGMSGRACLNKFKGGPPPPFPGPVPIPVPMPLPSTQPVPQTAGPTLPAPSYHDEVPESEEQYGPEEHEDEYEEMIEYKPKQKLKCRHFD